MALHFSDRADFKEDINVEECQDAAHVLERAEKKMHLALAIGGANPLAKISRQVESLLKDRGAQTFKELLLDCWDDCNDVELKEVISFLISTRKIMQTNDNKYALKV